MKDMIFSDSNTSHQKQQLSDNTHNPDRLPKPEFQKLQSNIINNIMCRYVNWLDVFYFK